MKERGNTVQSLLIAIGALAVLGFVGYLYITRDTTASTDLLVVQDSGTVGVDSDLLKALGQLKAIRLDTTIFSDPVFRSFFDFSTQLVDQPKGRPNPFAPLNAPASTQSSTTSTFR
ncbi:MAG: hypothetical protein WC763_04140 [Candidatus Paceibacterota bacterium]|jgi:hypothetical protein